MAILGFLAFTLIGQFLNVMLCLVLDRFISPHVGALAFVGLYVLVFAAAWKLSLYLFDDAANAKGNRTAASSLLRR